MNEAATTQYRKESKFEQESGQVRVEQTALDTSLKRRESAVEAQKLENTVVKEQLEASKTEHEADVKRIREAITA